MKPTYFLPWWPGDFVWREWRIADDLTSDPTWTKGYIWDYLPGLLDGILVSRWPLSLKRVKGLRRELRYTGVIIGDSGAHSYRALADPPYSCQHLLEFYAWGEFNYGMTLDVVAAPWVRPGGLGPGELEQRLALTIHNAERCLDLQQKHRYPVELIGVVQGWDVESYRRCVRGLLALGFRYIAIAGQRNISLLQAIILGVLEETLAIQDGVRVHVLGTGSAKILQFYADHGIASFDSATWFRQAWLSGTRNYFVVHGTTHLAFRATRIGLEPFEPSTLAWTTTVECTCPICEEVGQQVLLFRGRQRNFRRGFHNVHQYVQLLNTIRTPHDPESSIVPGA